MAGEQRRKRKHQSIAIVQVISDWRKIHLIDFFRKQTDANLFAREISEEKEPDFFYQRFLEMSFFGLSVLSIRLR